MNNRNYHIIDPKREILLQLQKELELEFHNYVDDSDFDVIVFLQALRWLKL